jgi:hypothetical protein
LPVPLRRRGEQTIGNLREVIGEFVFPDDEKMIAIGFEQSQVAKSLHEKLIRGRVVPTISDNSSWGNLQLDADAAETTSGRAAASYQRD